MEKKYIFVLHNGHASGDITKDCKIRLGAAAEVALEDDTVCFVGGGGLEPESGSITMQKCWNASNGKTDNTAALENSNNTAQSIREIVEYLNEKQISFGDAVIVSSQYHCGRIRLLCKDVPINVVPAENVLLKRGQKGIKEYLRSWEYQKKRLLEALAAVYTMLDREERIIQKIRKIQRKNKG